MSQTETIEQFNQIPLVKDLQNKRGYDFIPSGVLYKEVGGLALWLKHEKNEGLSVESFSSEDLLVRAPDRTLFATKESHENYSSRPEGYDQVTWLSPFHETFSDFDVPWIMLNVTKNLKSKNISNNCLPKGCLSVSDSGGFQIITGDVGYLSPVQIAKWYSHNAHYGMVLDVPYLPGDPDLIRLATKAQKINTERMKEHIHPSRLINVIHGMNQSEKLFKQVWETVEDESIERVSIPAMYTGTLVSGISSILKFIDDGGHRYKQIHILGVFNACQTVCLAKLATLKNVPYITSDASTHLQAACYHSFLTQGTMQRGLERASVGIRDIYGKTASNFKTLKCNCPVCNMLKYTDILGGLDGNIPMYLLSAHNMFESTRYLQYMYDLAKNTSWKEYREIARQMVGGRGSNLANEVDASLRFMEVWEQEGYKKAHAKFSHHVYAGGLFSETDIMGTGEAKDDFVSPQEFKDLVYKFINWEKTESNKKLQGKVSKAKLERGRSAKAKSIGSKKLGGKK